MSSVKPQDHGYEGFKLSDGEPVSPMAELCRWRLWNRQAGA